MCSEARALPARRVDSSHQFVHRCLGAIFASRHDKMNNWLARLHVFLTCMSEIAGTQQVFAACGRRHHDAREFVAGACETLAVMRP